MVGDFKKYSKIIKYSEIISKSNRINDFVKAIISLFVANYFGEIDKDDYEKNHGIAIDTLTEQMKYSDDNSSIKRSMRIIRDEWPEVYSIHEKLFDFILNCPGPTHRKAPCPYSSCGKYVTVQMLNYNTYECPHCYRPIEYFGGIYSTGGSSGGSGGDCFVAGAVYSNDYHPQVLYLRNFRDNYLNDYILGRLFIKIYYLLGPYLAKIVKGNILLKILFKDFLIEPLIRLLKRKLKKC